MVAMQQRLAMSKAELKTEYHIKNKMLTASFKEVSAIEYYEKFFGEDYGIVKPFGFTAKMNDRMYHFMTIDEALTFAGRSDIIYYPCRFVDRATARVKATRYQYAFIVDLDYLFSGDLQKLIKADFFGFRPTAIVNSGKGLHLVYIFSHKLFLGEKRYPYVSKVLNELKKVFVKKDMGYEVDETANPVHGYRLVGSQTKIGEVCRAFAAGPEYNFFELEKKLKPQPKTTKTKRKAKTLAFPQAEKGKTLAQKRGFYNNTLSRIMAGELQYGHYETGIFALYVIAKKVGVPFEIVQADVDKIAVAYGSAITDSMKKKAQSGYKNTYIKAYSTTLEGWLGFLFTRGKRYEKTMEQYQSEKKEATAEKIKAYLQEHPTATNTEIAKALGVNRKTIQQYVKDKNEKAIKQYLEEHPTAKQTEIAKALGLCRQTVSKYMK